MERGANGGFDFEKQRQTCKVKKRGKRAIGPQNRDSLAIGPFVFLLIISF
jgi:hypothetical protein